MHWGTEPLEDNISLPALPGREDTHLVLFFDGNPGVPEIYRFFLKHVHRKVQRVNKNVGVAVEGVCLDRFELKEKENSLPESSKTEESQGEDSHEENSQDKKGNGRLERQRKFLQKRLEEIAGRHDGTPTDKLQVTLIGHSVGAYLLLRILQEYHNNPKVGLNYEIKAGILLFPTVIEIAESFGGKHITKRINTDLKRKNVEEQIRKHSKTALLAGIGTSVFEHWQSARALRAFQKSPHGPNELVALGWDEMATITDNQFGREIFGSEDEDGLHGLKRPKEQCPKQFWYLGKKDIFVAKSTREKLMKLAYKPGEPGDLQKRNNWHPDTRPWMEKDMDKPKLTSIVHQPKRVVTMPWIVTMHGFTMQMGKSKMMASKVEEYMREVLPKEQSSGA